MNPSVGSEGTQLKIATLTPTPVGGLSLATAVIGMLLVGCPAGDDGNQTATSEDTEDDDSGDPTGETETSTTMMTMTATDTDTDTSDTDPPTTTESTGPDIEGVGCGITPTCDKGEFVGNLVYESQADIEMFAGYTSVTGWLTLIETDLACLDFLACIETVGKDIEISASPDLVSLHGLANV